MDLSSYGAEDNQTPGKSDPIDACHTAGGDRGDSVNELCFSQNSEEVSNQGKYTAEDHGPAAHLPRPEVFHRGMTIDEIWRLRPMFRAFAICNKPLDPAYPAVQELIASVAGPEGGFWGKAAQDLLRDGLPPPPKKGRKSKARSAEWDQHLLVELLAHEEIMYHASK